MQAEINGLIMPDCRALSKDIIKLRKSGETKIEKYLKNWNAFFDTVHKGFVSEIESISENCPPKRDVFSDDYIDKERENDEKNKKKIWKACTGEIPVKFTLQTYIKSSKIEDRIRMGKFVEDKCEDEVSKLWEVLMTFEKDFRYHVCKKKLSKISYNSFASIFTFPFVAPDIYGLTYTDYNNKKVSYTFNLDDENNIIHKAVEVYEGLFRDIYKRIVVPEYKAIVDSKLDGIKLNGLKDKKSTQKTKQNNKVFARGVERLKRLEKKLQKGFVSLKVEAIFNKKQAIEMVKDIENILCEGINKYVQFLNKNSANCEYYINRLRILAFQAHLIE